MVAELFHSLRGRTRFTRQVQYLITFYSRPETASDVISGKFVGPSICDSPVKFRYPLLNRSREIPSEVVSDGIFDRFLNFDHRQPEVARIAYNEQMS